MDVLALSQIILVYSVLHKLLFGDILEIEATIRMLSIPGFPASPLELEIDIQIQYRWLTWLEMFKGSNLRVLHVLQ